MPKSCEVATQSLIKVSDTKGRPKSQTESRFKLTFVHFVQKSQGEKLQTQSDTEGAGKKAFYSFGGVMVKTGCVAQQEKIHVTGK